MRAEKDDKVSYTDIGKCDGIFIDGYVFDVPPMIKCEARQ